MIQSLNHFAIQTLGWTPGLQAVICLTAWSQAGAQVRLGSTHWLDLVSAPQVLQVDVSGHSALPDGDTVYDGRTPGL